MVKVREDTHLSVGVALRPYGTSYKLLEPIELYNHWYFLLKS